MRSGSSGTSPTRRNRSAEQGEQASPGRSPRAVGSPRAVASAVPSATNGTSAAASTLTPRASPGSSPTAIARGVRPTGPTPSSSFRSEAALNARSSDLPFRFDEDAPGALIDETWTQSTTTNPMHSSKRPQPHSPSIAALSPSPASAAASPQAASGHALGVPGHLLIDHPPALSAPPLHRPAAAPPSDDGVDDSAAGAAEVHSEPGQSRVVPDARQGSVWQTFSAPVPATIARSDSEVVRDRLNTAADRQVQCILDSSLFDDELRGKLINVILEHQHDGDTQREASHTTRPSMDARYVADIEQAMKLSELTVQPNDPRQVPLVGERSRLERLIQSRAAVPGLVQNLEAVLPGFPEYRPVIGDGNCFYRCVAFGIMEFLAAQPRDAVRAFHVSIRGLVQRLGDSGLPDANCRAGYKHRFSKMLHELAALPPQPADLTAEQMLPVFCDDSAHLLISLLRHFTAFEMLEHPDQYETFLPALEGLRRVPGPAPPPLRAVVDALVLQAGVDAEHLMVQALATALQVPLGVVYADAGAPIRLQLIEPARRGEPPAPGWPWLQGLQQPAIFLLFRQGHYDLLYPDGEAWLDIPQHG